MAKESRKKAAEVEEPTPMAPAAGVEAVVRLYNSYAEQLRQVKAANRAGNATFLASNSSSAFLLPHIK